MVNVVFVPVSDELLFDHPEYIKTPLVPYQPGMRLTPAVSTRNVRAKAHRYERPEVVGREKRRND
ncbi:MAG: hypothetical protein DWQ08_04130 [Proteobacteria bacterium]|nr:MAG: hypothetical protein DWQ08_04130 [Pseudomonadota bacterium]